MKPKITIILNLILFSSITYCQPGKVLSYQRITYKVGNFNLPPDSVRNLGWNNCLLGDLNGDGKKEIFSISSGSHGHGYIFSLNTDGTVYQPRIIGRNKGLLDNATSTWYDFGSSCANIGDIDRDGITDLAIGNSGESGYGGDVFIIMLNSNGSIKNYKVLAAGKNGFNATLGTNDKFGASIISLGDIDKNKTTELVIGAPFTSDGASQAGAIWILSIDSTGFCTEYQKISHTTGGGNVLNINSNFTRFGSSSSKYTDIDGDQIPEFLVGAPNARYYGVAQGKFYGVSITSTKTIKAFKIISDTSQNFGDTILNPCTLSTSIGNIGDIDGNGFEDIALSTSYQGGILKRGLAKVLLMQNNFRIKSNILWDSLQNGIPTYDMFASFGFGLTGLGDINKDGRLDALVGIPGENKVQGSYGSCYVLFLDGKISLSNFG